MILDTSCVIAILAQESDAERYVKAISHASICRISAANFVELLILLEAQHGTAVARQCEALFRRVGVVIEPVTVDQAHLARQAFLDFGKGRHAARLNFGDCFAYALAKATGEPLLFKGRDFSKTDVEIAS
ncbi:MAG TPA: type II toxin-antitoxin system VapC family toxin [Acidobacteriaceae bacterium]|nr:type II toxin-antitoxin system VapC family toxin [Acidobacteriaceae bacterium]